MCSNVTYKQAWTRRCFARSCDSLQRIFYISSIFSFALQKNLGRTNLTKSFFHILNWINIYIFSTSKSDGSGLKKKLKNQLKTDFRKGFVFTIVRVGENFWDPNSIIISILTFENENKGKVTLVQVCQKLKCN